MKEEADPLCAWSVLKAVEGSALVQAWPVLNDRSAWEVEHDMSVTRVPDHQKLGTGRELSRFEKGGGRHYAQLCV